MKTVVIALVLLTCLVLVTGKAVTKGSSKKSSKKGSNKFDFEVQSSNTTNGLRVQFLGKSGQMKLFLDRDSDRWIKLKMGKLVELKPNSKKSTKKSSKKTTKKWKKTKTKVTSFASQDFTWTKEANVVLGQWPFTSVAQKIKFSTTLSVKHSSASVPFSFTTYVLGNTPAVVLVGDTNITVPANSIKWEIDISGWPFEAPENVLAFGMDIHDNSRHHARAPIIGDDDHDENNDDDEGKDAYYGESYKSGKGCSGKPSKKKENRLCLGTAVANDGYLALPRSAVVNGVNTNITVEVGVKGTHTVVSWLFPSFNTLHYDPVAVADPVGGNAESAAASLSASSLALVVFALVAAFTPFL